MPRSVPDKEYLRRYRTYGVGVVVRDPARWSWEAHTPYRGGNPAPLRLPLEPAMFSLSHDDKSGGSLLSLPRREREVADATGRQGGHRDGGRTGHRSGHRPALRPGGGQGRAH